MTKEQIKSYARLVFSYGSEPLSKGMWQGVLMLDFGFIVIGIEPDGYAHS
jgi:hypothetical protein